MLHVYVKDASSAGHLNQIFKLLINKRNPGSFETDKFAKLFTIMDMFGNKLDVNKSITLTKSQRRFLHESPEARAKRLARNAERMRQKRASESEEEYRKRMRRLAKNAERNRRRRQNETELERSIRRARSAARERLRRAMETPEQRAVRLAKLAERMRYSRANETPEQRAPISTRLKVFDTATQYNTMDNFKIQNVCVIVYLHQR
uniref:STPR domain-containing protein n=1 Tax=Anopheles atroparvus TaxID=41427 RepID=A0AAG5CTL9_ANOAO